MPYPHEEIKQLPFDRLDEENKIKFDVKKLPFAEKLSYEKMLDENIGKKFGEPYDIAAEIFREFEGKPFRSKQLRHNLTAARVLFSKKLDVMNDEFDTFIGALVADLIYKQHLMRGQQRANLERIDNFANNPISQMLIEDL